MDSQSQSVAQTGGTIRRGSNNPFPLQTAASSGSNGHGMRGGDLAPEKGATAGAIIGGASTTDTSRRDFRDDVRITQPLVPAMINARADNRRPGQGSRKTANVRHLRHLPGYVVRALLSAMRTCVLLHGVWWQKLSL
jgi:hypothetical protein